MNKTPILSFIRFGRAYAAECLPWFAPALFSTKIHLTEKVPVAAIDKHLNIYFNPLKMEKIRSATTDMDALKQIGFLWIHEISHVLREHNSRAAELLADPEIWNIAADMEINDSTWEGLEAPELYPGIFPHHFKMVNGELAETYYKKLTDKKESEIEKGLAKAMEKIRAEEEQEKEEQKEAAKDQSDEDQKESQDELNNNQENSEVKNDAEQDQENGGEEGESNDTDEDNDKSDASNNSKDGQSDSDEEASEEDENNSSPQENSDSNKDAQPDDEPKNSDQNQNPSQGNEEAETPKSLREQYADMMDEGSGVHNENRDWETETEGDDRQELDQLETEYVRLAVAKEMEEQLKAGTLPAGWERWAQLKLNPQVDWRKVLRHRLSRSINYSVGARTDYSFLRPSRRQSVYDPLLPPALSGDVTGQIACVVDTSASISDAQLSKILAEVWAILKTFNLPVTLIPCDAKPYDPIQLKQATDIHKIKNIPGGGGTNMIRGIEAALKLKPIPDVVVVLTDGYTPYPEKLYKTPVLFGIYMSDLNFTNMLPGPPWREDLIIKILLEE